MEQKRKKITNTFSTPAAKYLTQWSTWQCRCLGNFFLSLMELKGRLDIVWDTGLPFSLKSSMWEGQCGSKPVNMTSKAPGHLHWMIFLRADSYKFKSKLSWIAHTRWGLNQRLFVYLPSICVYGCIHRYICMYFHDITAQVFAGIHINTRQRSKVIPDQLIWRKKTPGHLHWKVFLRADSNKVRSTFSGITKCDSNPRPPAYTNVYVVINACIDIYAWIFYESIAGIHINMNRYARQTPKVCIGR